MPKKPSNLQPMTSDIGVAARPTKPHPHKGHAAGHRPALKHRTSNANKGPFSPHHHGNANAAAAYRDMAGAGPGTNDNTNSAPITAGERADAQMGS